MLIPKKHDYLSGFAHFYFAPRMVSIFTVFYLIAYGYASIYYISNAGLAIKYIYYTMTISTVFLSISHLFLGIAFIISLMVPFSLSVYAVFLLYNVWRHSDWSKHAKIVTTISFMIGSMIIIIAMDNLARNVARHDEMRSFVEDHYLNGRI